MPNRKNGRKKGKMVRGNAAFSVSPRPSLPRALGSNNLGAYNSVYPRIILDLPIVPQVFNVSSGSVANYIAVSSAIIANWSNWDNVFAQFTILGARFEARVVNVSSGQGLFVLAIDDSSTGSAQGANILYIPHIELQLPPTLTNVSQVQRISWICTEPNDLLYYPTSSTEASTSLQAYAGTSTTFTGSSTAATIGITGTVRVAFKGL